MRIGCRDTTCPSVTPTNRTLAAYVYTRYSVAGYGTKYVMSSARVSRALGTEPRCAPRRRSLLPACSTPNYWKVQQFCGGSVDNASPANEFCYTCEPPSSNETLSDFGIFPEPSWSPTWQQAVAYVTAHAGGGYAPVWDTDMVPGNMWTDPCVAGERGRGGVIWEPRLGVSRACRARPTSRPPALLHPLPLCSKTGIAVLVPGQSQFVAAKRDPYQECVAAERGGGSEVMKMRLQRGGAGR